MEVSVLLGQPQTRREGTEQDWLLDLGDTHALGSQRTEGLTVGNRQDSHFLRLLLALPGACWTKPFPEPKIPYPHLLSAQPLSPCPTCVSLHCCLHCLSLAKRLQCPD